MKLELVEIQTFVSNLVTARHFYHSILGFDVKHEGAGWIIFDINGLEFVIQSGAEPFPANQEYGKQCATMMVLNTPDIEQTYNELKEKGVEFFSKIISVPQGMFVGFKDPDGNFIELVQQKR